MHAPKEHHRTVLTQSYEPQIIDAMLAEGITPPPFPYIDGTLKKWGDTTKDKPFWCIFYIDDGYPNGQFGDWRKHGPEGVKWIPEKTLSGEPLTAQQRADLDVRMAERAAKKIIDQEAAAKACQSIFTYAPQATDDHPYLARKGIKAHGARKFGENLLLPVYSSQREIISLQYIFPDGEKRFHFGGVVAGGMWSIGAWPTNDGPIYIAEGFATAASIHEATDACVFIAFNASNLLLVAESIRESAGTKQKIVIVADNDIAGTGELWARKAEAAWGVDVVLIPTIGDANDYAQAGHDIKALLIAPPAPPPPSPSLAPKTQPWLQLLDDLLEDQSPIKWIVKNWLQEQTLIMIHGPASSGKTFLALDFCGHVAAGLQDWAGHKIAPGGIAYLAGEGNYGVRQRAAAWAQEHGVLKFGPFAVSNSGKDLDVREQELKVIKELEALNFPLKIIVVDTLHRFLAGDEDSARDAKRMVDACERLMTKFSCSVILVHHTGNDERSQARPRGSSAWTGDVGMRISLKPGKTIEDPIQISMLKAKDSEPAMPKSMKLKKISIKGWFDDNEEQVTSLVPIISDHIEETTIKKVEPKNLTRFKRDIFDAWQWLGGESQRIKPYISRSGLIRFLEEKKGLVGSTPKTYCNGARPGHIVHDLIAARIIEPIDKDGWIIIDDTMGFQCAQIA